MIRVALFYILKNLYVWFNGIQVNFHICFLSIVTCSFLKTSSYTYKRMRVRKEHRSLLQKQFDFVGILNKFHPQTTLLRTASIEKVMGIIYKMLWGAVTRLKWARGQGQGGASWPNPDHDELVYNCIYCTPGLYYSWSCWFQATAESGKKHSKCVKN